MGGAASKVGRSLKRIGMNYNLESRVDKEFKRQQLTPKPAPKHQTTVEIIKKTAEEHPGLKDELARKDEMLHDRLKGLHVDRVGEMATAETEETKQRSRPLNRNYQEEGEYGFHVPEVIPEGRFTLKQGIEFIAQHQMSPDGYTVEKIAHAYKLDEKDVSNILKYYKTLNVIAPKEVIEKNKQLLDQYKLEPGSLDDVPDLLKKDKTDALPADSTKS